MAFTISRRSLLIGMPGVLGWRFLQTAQVGDVSARLQAIQAGLGGRLGVAALDTGNNRRINFHAPARWPLCSTFKFLLVGGVLARVDSGKERLERAIAYRRSDLVGYAPITRSNIAKGQMTVYELCQAAICYSDNTAANLLFPIVGGPQGLTRYLRSLGDKTTNLNRVEPFLNESLPNDPRDTTSPLAMVFDMNSLLLRGALSVKSRALLAHWLVGNTTGNARLRAGLPSGWRVGDKTGTGHYGTSNDVAIVWPPRRKPLLIAAYITESAAPAPRRDKALAEVGRIIKAGLAPDSSSSGFGS